MAPHSEEDMVYFSPKSNLWEELTRNSDLTICDLNENSLFKEPFVNEELPETYSSISDKVLYKPSVCGTPESGWTDALDVLSEVSIVEDIYFEDDYLQDYTCPIYDQSIQSPQCCIQCIDTSKYSTDQCVWYENYIVYDKYEDSCIQDFICEPRKDSMSSFQDRVNKNLKSQEIKESCTIKQSCRRKHHSAPDILCHDKYLSCCTETQTGYDSAIEEILSHSLLGLQIAFDCSFIDNSICSEDICNTVCQLHSDIEMSTNGQCRNRLQETMQPISDTLALPSTNSDLELLIGECPVVHQHKYKRKIEISPVSTNISSLSADQMDNDIQIRFHHKDPPESAVIVHCDKPARQCHLFTSSNDKSHVNILSVLQNIVPLTSKQFQYKDSELVCLSGNDLFVNITINFESPLYECKFTKANRMRWFQQRLYILYVHLMAALLVPINADVHSTTRVNRNFLLICIIAHQIQYTLTKCHFMNPNKKHTRKKNYITKIWFADI